MSEKLMLETQSFQLELDRDTFAPVKIGLINEEVASLYEDDKEGITLALVRELAMNLQASKELLVDLDNQLNEETATFNEENQKLEDQVETLTDENAKLRSDNELLRDELDNVYEQNK